MWLTCAGLGRGRITWQGGRGWGVDSGSPGQACGAFLFVSCLSQWDLEGHPFNSSLLHSGTGSPSLCALWENSQVTPICKTHSRDSLPSRRRTRYVSPDAEKAVDETQRRRLCLKTQKVREGGSSVWRRL